ncbi:MAG: hypothetical protein FH748_14505 [Balneolaceae bacterium]|nr:hypothetical protein [Balneolaceae bacterium]
MNVGIVTSFIVAGLMILSIMAFNHSIYTSSAETTITTINQNNLDNLTEIISNDMNRIGYKTGSSDNFNHIYSQDVEFQGDIYDNDSHAVTTVRWYLDTSDSVSTTTNSNDVYLKRTGPTSDGSISTLKYPVTHFELKYFAGDGTETTNTINVKSIQVEVVMESGEYHTTRSDGKKQYHRTVWKRTFVPNNLNF